MNRPFRDLDVMQPPGLVHRSLYRGAAHASERGDLVDREVANAIAFDLASDDAEHRSLAFGVVVPEVVRERAGAAEHSSAVPRCPSIRRALPLAGQETAYAAVHLTDDGELAC